MRVKTRVLSAILAGACSDDSGGSGSSGDDGSAGEPDSSADDRPSTDGGSDGGSESDGGSGSESVDTGSESDTGGVDPTPILERDPMISHSCVETREMTQYPAAVQARNEAVALAGGEFAVLSWGFALEIRHVGLDGSLGDPVVLDELDYATTDPTMLADGDELVIVWSTGDFADETMRFARLAADLTPIAPPMDIPEIAGSSLDVAALAPAAGGGFAVFYGEADAGGSTTLRFMSLSSDGQSEGPAVDLADIGETYSIVPAAVAPAPGGGHALAYVTSDVDGGEVFFTVVDADGTPQYEPRRISGEAGGGWSYGFGRGRRNVVAVDDRFWVVHTEDSIDFENQMGHAILRIAIVDADGDSESHVVQAPVEGRENRWPSFAEMDDRVGLMWTQGTIIWICAGCIGDQDQHFVLIDPDAVVPASEVATQLHTNNGIVAPVAAVDGGDILTAASLDFHAVTLPASGAMHCDPT
jgi:hypothetical protein